MSTDDSKQDIRTEPTTKIATTLSDRQLRIAVGGSVNASKSSSVGVLTTGILDDGCGSARSSVLKLPHEKSTGRSSTVSYNYITKKCANGARQIITMVDLCGHTNYLRTTLYGITAHRIDYGMVVVGSNMGVNVMENGSFANSVTAEHINILHQLSIPFFIVMSKRDLCTGVPGSESHQCKCLVQKCACKTELARNPEYQKTRRDIVKLIRELAYQPVWVDALTTDDLLELWTVKLVKMVAGGTKFVPIIVTSNKTGFNINLLGNFITNIPPRINTIYDTPNTKSSTFFVEARYWKKGIGLIISGTLRGKTVNTGDKLLLGPFSTTRDTLWHEIRIKGIHNNLREPVNYLEHGQTGCFSIACPELERKSQLRLGLVAVSTLADATSTREFTAEIKVLNHATSITNRYVLHGKDQVVRRYQAVLHCLNVRQTATMMMQTGDIVRSGETKTVGFRFIRCAEHIEIGSDFLFCEGKTRGIGRVTAFGLPESAVNTTATGIAE